MAPQATFGGKLLHQNIEEIAAAYLVYICQNHPFIDGNKRAAIRAALVYLIAHNYAINASIDTLEKLVLEVAQGKLDKQAVTKFFKANSTKDA